MSVGEGEDDNGHVMGAEKSHTDDQVIQALRFLRALEMASFTTSSKSPDSHISRKESG
jgi:hypothetical protein